MTVEQCTRGCREIGQPLAALNSGTVRRTVLWSLLHLLIFSALADQSGRVALNLHHYRAVPYAAGMLISDAADGPVNPVCTGPKLEPIPPSRLATSAAGKRRPRKQSKVSASGSTLRASIVVARYVQQRTSCCLV